MGGASRWLCRGLLLLVSAGCGQVSRTLDKAEPWCWEDQGTRPHCSNSATLRIQVLLARGELEQAEALLVQALAAGLMSQTAAEPLRERLAERKQQQPPGTERPLPPILPEEPRSEESPPERRGCWTELPSYPVCQQLPGEYTFHSARQALEAMKQRLEEKGLTLHKPAATNEGPCPSLGQHFNVRMNGKRAGSITCCPCCVDTARGPLEWTKCRIVW